MAKLKISQIQFSASHIANLNAKNLEQNFKKTLKFKPHLICTPECSNIITNDKNFLLLNAPYQNTCPVLKIAKNFAKKNNISNINFVNADIFDDVLKENFFDFIWCNGVLHHTKNPYKAFEILIRSLKKNGYVLIGLYNKYGRIRTLIRKYLYKMFGKKLLLKVDPTLRNLKLDENEQTAWIRDQYTHPIESLHTIDEVLEWFKKNGIDYVSSIPSGDFDYDYNNIFEKKNSGTFFSRILNQLIMIFNRLGSDGGLFVVIGKKH